MPFHEMASSISRTWPNLGTCICPLTSVLKPPSSRSSSCRKKKITIGKKEDQKDLEDNKDQDKWEDREGHKNRKDIVE